jgi:two-component system sensor histidine kinase RegB
VRGAGVEERALRQAMASPAERSMAATAPDPGPLAAATARKNLIQLAQLRWIAVAGQLGTIAFVELILRIQLPLVQMGAVLAVFVAGNLLFFLRLRLWGADVTNHGLFLALGFDAVILTALLSLSGGPTNPFTSLYLLQVCLGAVLLDGWAVWAMIGVAAACIFVLSQAYVPLRPPPHGPDLLSLYIGGALVSLAMNAVLIVTFISRINANLQARDQRLAALRQRAVEDDHIVRMGLLASGAAHELGTPLATLAVILGDWRRMPKLAKDPELAGEIEDMRAEVARCKAIVTGVLLSAGEARGEAASVSSLRSYLGDLFEEWKARRAPAFAQYEDDLAADPMIVADSALKQALVNLLDNAFEASPEAVWMFARLQDGLLRLRVRDAGAGFPPEMLTALGRPYQSTKGRPGGGIGLFLVMSVVRQLDGRVEARNLYGGGAEVEISLPLSTLAIGAAA